MNYPALGTLGTTWTGEKLGEEVGTLLDLVLCKTNGFADEARQRLVLLSARYGRRARTNIGLTGRPIVNWDLERIAQVDVEVKK